MSHAFLPNSLRRMGTFRLEGMVLLGEAEERGRVRRPVEDWKVERGGLESEG